MSAPAYDSTAVLRELLAQFPEIPVTYAPCYCEQCQADYAACPRDGGSDHPTCPLVCASCAEPLPHAEHADVLCAACEDIACSDDNDERKYREAL